MAVTREDLTFAEETADLDWYLSPLNGMKRNTQFMLVRVIWVSKMSLVHM